MLEESEKGREGVGGGFREEEEWSGRRGMNMGVNIGRVGTRGEQKGNASANPFLPPSILSRYTTNS